MPWYGTRLALPNGPQTDFQGTLDVSDVCSALWLFEVFQAQKNEENNRGQFECKEKFRRTAEFESKNSSDQHPKRLS